MSTTSISQCGSATSPRNPKGNMSTRLASPIVSACRYLLQPNGSINGNKVAEAILPNFPDLCSALPADYFANRQALLGVDATRKSPLTHARVRDFILKELGPQLHELGYGRGNRIALVLPNGPELALAILGMAHWVSVLPLNANGAPSELKKDLQAARAAMIVGMADDSAAIEDMARALNIPFCGLVPSETEVGVFRLLPKHVGHTVPSLMGNSSSNDICCSTDPVCTSTSNGGGLFRTSSIDHPLAYPQMLSNEHEDEVLVLFTSGTTGNKKLVPHKLGDIIIAAAVISVSWNLLPEDVNCNLMPLFHVGGIVRQVFAPILSAGSVICCPSFDPQLFWNLLAGNPNDVAVEPAFTWYYAAPTMHQVILNTMPEGLRTPPRLRMIANAAGGLLPSLAQRMRNVFGANILPSYGMTECMPISSPPFNYKLEKPGTSGVAVGPEVTIFSSNFEVLEPGKEGSICVRGRPCFRGYGGQAAGESFLEGGWFNTGDLGYLDEDGYLYITGRSKEVINRGGEIISPMEVEEEVLQHPAVKACLAFSTTHSVLQETVGIVVVFNDNSAPRIDLPTLHQFLQERLATAKWPQCIVYMDALPKSHTNKLLRVKLGQRLNLPELNDGMYPVERTFEATCPPQGTPVGVSIPCEQVTVDTEYVEKTLMQELEIWDPYSIEGQTQGQSSDRQLLVTPHPTKVGGIIVHVVNIDRLVVARKAKECLDAYLQPSHIIRYYGKISRDTIKKLPDHDDTVASITSDNPNHLKDPMIQELQGIMMDMIDLDCLPAPDSNFFHVGGSSLLASQLASKIRKRYQVSFSGAEVFRHNTCIQIAQKIQSQKPEYKTTSLFDTSMNSADQQTSKNSDGFKDGSNSGSSKQCPVDLQNAPFDIKRLPPQNSFLTSLFQLLPMVGVFPLWQFSRFYLFFMALLHVLGHVPGESNLLKFIITLVVFHFLWVLITPLIFVLLKWIVIGKYQEGRYPIWGGYYLRWWFIDVCRKIFGHGIWGSHNDLLVFYYRLLGAKIGSNVRISLQADIAEFDLVTIGDDSLIEYATMRAFGVDNGAMILGPVELGDSSTIGIRSIVAPYTMVPNGAHVGPGTSSYEITHEDDRHRLYNRYAVPEPKWWMLMLVGQPIIFLVDTFSHIPAMTILYMLVTMHHRQNEGFHSVGDLMEWLCEPNRIPYYIAIRVVRATVAPLMYMFAAIIAKWTVIGRFEPGPRNLTSQWQLMRHWLAAKLFSRENMQEVTDLLGRHYGAVSTLYRLLGAKIGRRVFWPGHQPVFSGEFDLLEIGDDVVFGSRTCIVASSTEALEKVIFCAGANISDNTIVLPGSIIGKNAVLGSNTVCPAGRYLPESSIWLGSKGGEPILLEEGTGSEEYRNGIVLASDVKVSSLPMNGDESTLRPFGKATDYRLATYFVWPQSMMAFLSLICNIVFATTHAFPLVASIHIAGCYLYGISLQDRDYDGVEYGFFELYYTVFAAFLVTHMVRVAICLIVEISSKWIFMGRRIEGRYNWDTSSYNQRWEFYQLSTRIRRIHRIGLLDFFAGTPMMTWYFRMLGAKIGDDCCLFPAGGDPFFPEPDLVTVGNRVAIDMASVVTHLNTRGNFELVCIKIDDQATLRARSRVQQGVHVEAGAMLLEKSLALTGEVVESDSVWQGAPASMIFSYERIDGIPPSASFAREGCLQYTQIV